MLFCFENILQNTVLKVQSYNTLLIFTDIFLKIYYFRYILHTILLDNTFWKIYSNFFLQCVKDVFFFQNI